MAEIAKISLKSAFPNPEFVKKSDEVFKELALYLARHSDALRRVDESGLDDLRKQIHLRDRQFVERTVDFLQSDELQNLMQSYNMLKNLYESAREDSQKLSRENFDLREKYDDLQTNLQTYFSSLETLKTLI